MAQRDRGEFSWGGDRRSADRSRAGRRGRGGHRSSRVENYGDQAYDEYELGSTYERSRGREHLGEYPRGQRDYGRRRPLDPRERDLDAYGGYGGRGGGYWESEAETETGRQQRGTESRNPYYGGGGLFGGGMGGYTGGGYLGGGFGSYNVDDESEDDRGYRRQEYRDPQRYDRPYGRGSRGSGRDYATRRADRGDDRGFFDRMADEVSSWFSGDEDGRDDRRERSFRGRGPRNYIRSDERIKEDINDRLTYHYAIDASDVDVEVSGGEVVLSGGVRSRYEKRLAEDIADDVNGVRNVENRLRVNRDSSGWKTASEPAPQNTFQSESGPASTTSATNTETTTGSTRSRTAGGAG